MNNWLLAFIFQLTSYPGKVPPQPTRETPVKLNRMVTSWYGHPYHGRKTASGEVFDMNAMTAAHPYLPFGTRLRCSLGGQSVVVRITDRGPTIPGRDLDLSRGAAAVLGMVDAGVFIVDVEVVS